MTVTGFIVLDILLTIALFFNLSKNFTNYQ